MNHTDKSPGIQPRMGLLLLAFFLLVAVSAGLTFWGIDQQKQDGLTINLAGRQRMYIQQMTRLALEIERNPAPQPKTELQRVASDFSQTLLAFRDGGEVPYLENQFIELFPSQDQQIQAQIDLIAQNWENFQTILDQLAALPSGSPEFEASIQKLETQSPQLIEQADMLVRQYEALSTARLKQLRIIQMGFVGAALALLAAGALITRSSILAPLTVPGHVRRSDRVWRFGNAGEPFRSTGSALTWEYPGEHACQNVSFKS